MSLTDFVVHNKGVTKDYDDVPGARKKFSCQSVYNQTPQK